MNHELDELYFEWLYSQTGDIKTQNPARTYKSLLMMLYDKEFVWFIPNDDNRSEDGKDLRYEFIDDLALNDVDILWMELGCSVLEMLVGLSRRLSFEAEGEPRYWFWELMKNLKLDIYNDKKKLPTDFIEEKLDRLIWRTYEPDGTGGLFPLKYPEKDQRDTEIWYQLAAYILERK